MNIKIKKIINAYENCIGKYPKRYLNREKKNALKTTDNHK